MKERLLNSSFFGVFIAFLFFGISNIAFAENSKSNEEDSTETTAEAMADGDDIILNGDFASGDLTNWTTFIADFAGVSADINVTDGEAHISNITNAGGEVWHIQLNQELTGDQISSLNVGAFYTITFDARSDTEGRQLRLFFGEDGGGFVALQSLNVELTTTMETYSVTFPVTTTFGAMKLGFEMGLSNADVYIDNVMLQEGGNIIENGDFETGDLASWTTFNADFDGVFADFNVTGGEAHITNITGVNNTVWHVQLNQILTADQIAELETGQNYTIMFDARASEVRNLSLFFGEDQGGFATLERFDIDLTTDMQTYMTVFEVTNTYSQMKLGFELGLSAADVYIDNVALVKGGEIEDDDGGGSDNALDLPVTFEDEELDYGLTDFGGNNSEIVADPTDASNRVVQSEKTDAAEVWAGTTVGEPDGFATPIAFSDGNTTMSVRVWSPTADTPIRVKVEDSNDAAISVETEAMTTLAEQWETLEFDFSNEAEGTAAINFESTYNKLSIFFNFGTSGADAGAQTYFWDDIKFGDDDTNGESEPADDVMEQNFIAFANGRHVTIPSLTTGDVITDPTDETNNVIEFNFGGFQIGGFNWGEAGVDMSQRVADGDHIIFRLWSSAENSADARAVNNNNPPKLIIQDASTVDGFAFRAQLEIPDEFHNEEWHEMAIPLPEFLTQTELEEAKDAGDLDGFSALWEYWGTWSSERNVHVDSPEDPDWREFNWDRVRSIGIYWDQDPFPNAPIFIDDVAIGVPGEVDFDIASDVPAPLTSVTATNLDDSNVVSWTPREDIAAYSVYFSGEPITDISADNVFFWKTVPFTSDVFEETHHVFSPLDADPEHTYHYAVSASNLWGLPNDDVSQAQASVTAEGERSSWIFQLTAEEENAILNHLETGGSTLEGWPTDEFPSFKLNAENSAHPATPESEEELSAEAYMAYGNSEGETIFYVNAQVFDDELVFNPAIEETEQVDWNFFKRDHFQIRMGTYEVDYVTGPTNNSFSENDQSDYLFNFWPVVFVESFEGLSNPQLREPDAIWVSFAGENNFPFAFPAAFDLITNESGEAIGYQINFAFTASELLAGSPTDEAENPLDELFTPPGDNEFFYIPMTPSVVDDRDDGRARPWENAAHQLFYSWKPNFGSQFFSTPSDLSAIAIAGRGVATSVDEPFAETPNKFELRQNYPNPFNPSTQIEFQMPRADQVKLTVYNSIGQQVATLINREQFSAGTHTISFNASNLASGMYIYRLEAGSQVLTRKMLLIK